MVQTYKAIPCLLKYEISDLSKILWFGRLNSFKRELSGQINRIWSTVTAHNDPIFETSRNGTSRVFHKSNSVFQGSSILTGGVFDSNDEINLMLCLKN
jgi:hypothetical protein